MTLHESQKGDIDFEQTKVFIKLKIDSFFNFNRIE